MWSWIDLKTREEPIEDPVETSRKIAEARNFSQRLTDEVVSSYLIEPERNRFGVINAFTNARAEIGAASENRNGTVCRDAAGRASIVLFFNHQASERLPFLFLSLGRHGTLFWPRFA